MEHSAAEFLCYNFTHPKMRGENMKKLLSAAFSVVISAGMILSQIPAFAVEKDVSAGIVSTESGSLNVRSTASGS